MLWFIIYLVVGFIFSIFAFIIYGECATKGEVVHKIFVVTFYFFLWPVGVLALIIAFSVIYNLGE